MRKSTKVFLSLASLFANHAWALTCNYPVVPIEEKVRGADYVFSGKFAKSLGATKGPENSNQHALVTVTKMFKGPELKSVKVFFFRRPFKSMFNKDEFPDVNCSRKHFDGFSTKHSREKDFLFFGKLVSEKLYISYELGTSPLSDKRTLEDYEKLPRLFEVGK